MSYARSNAARPANRAEAGGQETTRDSFLDGRLSILQPKKGPRAAIDPLFLAAAIPVSARRAERVLEAGIGVGVASLALAARAGDVRITGVDTQQELLRLAQANARHNGFEDRISLIRADITASGAELEKTGLRRERFDHVTANPPYHVRGRGRRSANRARAEAHMGEEHALEQWVRFLAGMAAGRGTLTMIHQPGMLGELLRLLKGRFGGLVIFPLFSRRGDAAIRVLVQGVKGSRAPTVLAPGMVLQQDDGAYLPEAEAVLRQARPLDLERFRK